MLRLGVGAAPHPGLGPSPWAQPWGLWWPWLRWGPGFQTLLCAGPCPPVTALSSLRRWQQSAKSSGLASNLQPLGAKADALREEMEEAANRVEICRVPGGRSLLGRGDLRVPGTAENLQPFLLSRSSPSWVLICAVQPTACFQLTPVITELVPPGGLRKGHHGGIRVA